MMKEELSGGMSSLAHWTMMFSFFRRNSLFTVKKAKKMERFVTANRLICHLISLFCIRLSVCMSDLEVVLLIHNSIAGRAIYEK